MKKRKKIFIALILSMCMITEPILASDSEPSITLPDTSSAYCTNYTKRRDLKVKYEGQTIISTYQVKKGATVGIVHYYIGKYRNKKKIGGKYYDGILVKMNMEPVSVFATNKKGKKKKMYGFSQYVSLKSTLPKNCQIQDSTPNNATTGASPYSIGISGGSDSASVSGNVNINSEYCKVTDNTKLSQEKYAVSYDYKPTFFNVFDWSADSERSTILFDPTWQVGTCEWTSSQKNYSINLKIYAKFGLSEGKSGGETLVPYHYYSSGSSTTRTLKYSKKAK